MFDDDKPEAVLLRCLLSPFSRVSLTGKRNLDVFAGDFLYFGGQLFDLGTFLLVGRRQYGAAKRPSPSLTSLGYRFLVSLAVCNPR